MKSLAILACMAGCAGTYRSIEKPTKAPQAVSQPQPQPEAKLLPDPPPMCQRIIADKRDKVVLEVFGALIDPLTSIERVYLAIDELEHLGDKCIAHAKRLHGKEKIDLLRNADIYYRMALDYIDRRQSLLHAMFVRSTTAGQDGIIIEAIEALERKREHVDEKMRTTAAQERI